MMYSIGDLARNYQGRLNNARIRGDLNTLAQELTTGRKADVRSALSGDVAPVAAIERSLGNLSAYRTVTSEASLFVTAAQNALGTISDQLEALASASFTIEETTEDVLIRGFGRDADSRFQAIVNAMNTTISGRSVFAGEETGQKPVADAEVLLDDIVAALPPAADAQDVIATVDAYFADGGAFESTRYNGSDIALAAFRVSPRDALSFDVRAERPELRAILSASAKLALVDRTLPGIDPDERKSLIRTAGREVLAATTGLIAVRAEVGVSEGRVEDAIVRNSAEKAALELSRGDLISADPYETATRLQATQTQLETFFSLTARLSRLNLNGYL